MAKVTIADSGSQKPGKVRGLGVASHGDKISLYYYSTASPEKILVAESTDGLEFERSEVNFSIKKIGGENEDLDKLSSFKISRFEGNLLLCYELDEADKLSSFLANSYDLSHWQSTGNLSDGVWGGTIVTDYKHEGQFVMYAGGNNISAGFSKDGKNWKFEKLNLLEDKNYFVDFITKTSQGIFIIYHSNSFDTKAVCLDINNPTKVLWQTNTSLWQEPLEWRNHDVNCLGCVYFQGRILAYWNIKDVGIFLISYPVFESQPAHEKHHYKLEKHPANPVLTAKEENAWENEAVFNPAAFYENGKVYLLYRAVGHDYVSVLGYAESTDGIHFGERLNEPIYAAREPFEIKGEDVTYITAGKYMSGAGYGGCEDPRVTKIGDRLYMVYVAFNGWEPPRLAMTSILLKNFLNHNFLWTKPVLISPPGVVDKSGSILPEKINGKYVIFHRIFPNILIDFVDSLEFDGTSWLKGEFAIRPRPNMWDSRKVGTGAPPIKTDEGWLLIYQGVGETDSSKYKIGAMLLDLNDPTKVLHRSNHPIIEPTEYYENGLAKFGVVYPCGAVIVEDQLMVYYGGSDSVTCVATANLKEFLKRLTEDEEGTLRPVEIPQENPLLND